jgi:hypothetical protein
MAPSDFSDEAVYGTYLQHTSNASAVDFAGVIIAIQGRRHLSRQPPPLIAVPGHSPRFLSLLPTLLVAQRQFAQWLEPQAVVELPRAESELHC